MKDLLKDDEAQGDLEEKRENQPTRDRIELHLSTGDIREVEDVEVIHAVEGWTLFERENGEQVWAKDDHLCLYKDPEGRN